MNVLDGSVEVESRFGGVLVNLGLEGESKVGTVFWSLS